MAVGVPEKDVFAAADAVLARGERPTVERVRQELGRGSPARVGALLDDWWEHLAGRLRGETRLPGLPAEVAQAFVAIWKEATTLAAAVAEQTLQAQRDVLNEERHQLAEADALRRQELTQAQRQTAEAIANQKAVETRLADLEQLSCQRQVQIDDLLAQRDQARKETAGVREEMQAAAKKAAEERDELQHYLRSVEDRAHREVDRAREESRLLSGQLKEVTQKLQKEIQEKQSKERALADSRQQGAEATAKLEALTTLLESEKKAVDMLNSRAQAQQERQQALETDLGATREELAATHAREAMLGQRVEELTLQLSALQESVHEQSRQRAKPGSENS